MSQFPRLLRRYAALTAILAATPLGAAQIDLRSPDGAIHLSGELGALEPDAYLLKTSLGLFRVPRDNVDCLGDACPAAARARADLVLRQADTASSDLLPLLLDGYAQHLGGAITERRSLGDGDTTVLRIAGDAGFGSPLLTAEIEAPSPRAAPRQSSRETAEIVLASGSAPSPRLRTQSERAARPVPVALSRIDVVVSPENPVSRLSLDSLAAVFSGRIDNWAQLGGPDLPITLLATPGRSAARGLFAEVVLAPRGAYFAETTRVLATDAEIRNAVIAEPGAIAYVGSAYRGGTKALDLVSACGLTLKPTDFAAKTGEYPLQQPVSLSIEAQGGRHGADFLRYASSPDAASLVRKAGYLDLGVAVDPFGLDPSRVMAGRSETPEALPLAERMIADLGWANRLSSPLRFLSGGTSLDQASRLALDAALDVLMAPAYRGREILVAGYADASGDFDLNARLAQERAAAVRAAILAHPKAAGLDPRRLRAVSYGELAPVACNDTAEGRRLNRRVELWFK